MKRRQVGSGNHSLLWDSRREAGYDPGLALRVRVTRARRPRHAVSLPYRSFVTVTSSWN